MKILYVVSHLANDGPVHALLSIATGLQKLGHDEITVLTMSSPEKDTLAPRFAELGIPVHNIPVRFSGAFAAVFKIRRFLKRERFDVAASTCIRADAMLAGAAVGVADLKIVTTVQNVPAEDLGYLYPGWSGRIAAWLHYQVLKRFGKRIVCCSGLVRDHLRGRIGVQGRHILNPVVAPVVLFPELGGTPAIIYAASLSARKNPDEALSFVLGTLDPLTFHLQVFGRGPLEASLREKYRDRQEIMWRGFTDNLPLEFAGASVYVSASQSEGFPLTPQLALIYGCPCVLSDIAQHQELAALSQFVFIYRAGDQADFSRALGKALKADRSQARHEGVALREKISPEAVAGELRTFYTSM
jgi:glycosyltransferase involved in cell wall biosynthesis